MLKRSISWLAIAAIATFSGVGLAFDDEFAGDRNPGRMLAYLADELDLSQEQEDEIRALYAEMQEQNEADRARLGELRELMKAQVEDFDAGTAQKYADEIGEIATRLAYVGVSHKAAVHDVLTPEQRELLEEMMQRRAERQERWRDKRREGKPPRRSADSTD